MHIGMLVAGAAESVEQVVKSVDPHYIYTERTTARSKAGNPPVARLGNGAPSVPRARARARAPSISCKTIDRTVCGAKIKLVLCMYC
jgi:hypothetical protein